jgi:signal transduction histidine kinase/sensor domain CHASE-containing protein
MATEMIMSLRSKLLIFMALLALVPLILFGITASVVSTNSLKDAEKNNLDSLSVIEKDNLVNALDSVNSSLADIQQNLSANLTDYVNWDDLHAQAVLDSPDTAWIDSNVGASEDSSAFYTFNLNVVGLWNRPNNLTFKSGPADEFTPVVTDLFEKISTVETPQATFIPVGNDIYVIAVRAVRKTDGTNPQGAFLFGRKLNSDDLVHIKALTGYDVALYQGTQPIAASDELAPNTEMLAKAAVGEKSFDQSNPGVAFAYQPLQDNNGKTVGAIVISRPRNTIITAQQNIANASVGAQESISRSLLLWAVIGSVLAVAAAFMVGNAIANPLQALVATAGKIANGDLSQRVIAPSRDELGQMANAFNQMADKLANRVTASENENVRLQAIDEYRLNLLTLITQAMQTPITAIKSHASSLDMAMYGTLNDAQRRSVNAISRSITMEEALLSDLLDFARAQQGQLRISRERVSLDEVVKETLSTSKEQYSEKNIQFATNIPDSLPELWADPIRMQQVLDNLMGTAFEYTVPNGRIELSAYTRDNLVEISITDTSSGLQPEEQSRIFELFYHPTSDTKASNSATGSRNHLGLALVKALVEQQGGNIRLEVQPGKGNMFAFTVPAAA